MFTSEYPEYVKDIGLLWHDDSSFLINTRIFSLFTRRKPNSVNRNFRDHKFQMKKSTSAVLSEHKINDQPKCWMLRWNKDFKPETKIDEMRKKKITSKPHEDVVEEEVLELKDFFTNNLMNVEEPVENEYFHDFIPSTDFFEIYFCPPQLMQ